MSRRSEVIRTNLLYPLVILAAIILVYGHTLRAPFYFDDTRNIVQNPLIRDLGYFTGNPLQATELDRYFDIQVRGIPYLTFALNYAAHGLRVEGYHVVNIAIHVITALLVYALMLQTFQTPLMKGSRLKERAPLVALFAALLFAVHPVQTQAVTYIVQRITSLAALFYVLSLVLYVLWRLERFQATAEAADGSPARRWGARSAVLYGGCLLAALLAMRSKEIAITLPIMILLYEVLFFRGSVRERLRFLTPILLTLLIIPLSYLAYAEPVDGSKDLAYVFDRSVEKIHRTDYLLTQMRVVATYLRLFLVPVRQNLDYDYPVSTSLFSLPVVLSILLHCSILLGGLYLARRSRTADPAYRLAAFGIFWFYLALSVESSIIPLFPIFEHRLYLPSVGLVATSTVLAFSIPERSIGKVIAFLSASVLVLAVTGHVRNRLWNDPVAFWSDVVSKSPQKARAYQGLAEAYTATGRQEEARRAYQDALRLDPDDEYHLTNLMLANVELGKVDEVFSLFEQALRAGRDSARARNYVSLAYYRTGRIAEAERQLRISIGMDPKYDDARFNLAARVMMEQGRYEEAEQQLREVLRINPEHDRAHNSLGIIYAASGRIREAEQEFLAAVWLNPESMEQRSNLAGIYAQTGRLNEAEKEYQRALQRDPVNSDVRMNLAIFLAEQRRYAEALEELAVILRLHPNHEQARQYFERLSTLPGMQP